VVGFLVDLYKKSNKGIRLTGFIFIFFFVATLASFASIKTSEYLATNLANKVIASIYNYKKINGQFPSSVDLLNLDKNNN